MRTTGLGKEADLKAVELAQPGTVQEIWRRLPHFNSFKNPMLAVNRPKSWGKHAGNRLAQSTRARRTVTSPRARVFPF
jgi:hypothetical protein